MTSQGRGGWVWMLGQLLPAVLTLITSIAAYYQARTASIEATNSAHQSRSNGEWLERHKAWLERQEQRKMEPKASQIDKTHPGANP